MISIMLAQILQMYYIFFPGSGVPEGFTAQSINGFVEELVVNDDPEYQWIDKIRTPRYVYYYVHVACCSDTSMCFGIFFC